MTAILLEYRIRIRNAADSADALVVSSTRGGTNPYLTGPPQGDGSEFDPLTGAFRSGSMTFRIVDAITGGTSRLVTSQLEDTDFRQQLSGRAAFGEIRENGGAWNIVQAGIITAIRLASASTWEIDIGDTMRATRNRVAFAPKRLVSDATKVELLSTFIARWPVRGCLAGGPVRGGFLRQPDLGGWEMRVVSTQGAGTNIVKGLAFVSGYIAPEFMRTTDANAVRDLVNTAVGDPTGPATPSTFPADLVASLWPDLVVQVNSAYYAAAWFAQGLGAVLSKTPQFFAPASVAASIYVADPTNALTVGSTIVKVRVFDALPSDRCAIYYTGHPLDLFTALCDEAGLAYDSAAVTTTKNALGTSLRINLRITSQEPLASFLESTLYGPVGFSVRTNSAGQLVPFTTRVSDHAAPSLTITSADVPSDEAALFELTEADAVTKVIYNQSNLVTTFSTSDVPATGRTAVSTSGTSTPRVAIAKTTPAADGVSVQSVRVERTSGDSAAAVQREQTYTIPGFLDYGGGSYDAGIVDARAKEIFDRMSRGRLSGEFTALRGGAGDPIVLGDEIILAVLAMPNHNKRLGDDNTIPGRVVQVVRLTPTPRGHQIRFLDSGPAAQTLATLPVITLAAGTSLGTVLATITNAAALNAAGIGARLRWAQTTGAAPAAGDYTDVAAFAPGLIPTTAILLTGATAGNTVFVIGRSEQPGSRPTNYSASVSIATAAFAAPSGLGATPDVTDGSRCALVWTPGASTGGLLTDVFVRLTADPASADVRQFTLLPGSVGYKLEGLTPSAGYTASVQHREPSTGQVSAKTTVAFTAGATTVTLTDPTSASGFSGSLGVDGVAVQDGTYGIQVTATAIPGFVEVYEAVETAIGSAVYGAFAALGLPVPSVQSGPTRYVSIAPNDGRRRRLKARHIRPGATASGFTTFVTVLPWSASAPGVAGTTGELLGQLIQTSSTPTSVSYLVRADDTDPAGSTVTVAVTTVNCSITAGPSAATMLSGGGSITFTVARPAVNGNQGEIVVDFTAPARVADRANESVHAQGQDSSPVVALTVKDTGDVQAVISGNNNTASFKWLASTSAMPADATVIASGTIVNGRTATLAAVVNLALGQRCFFKMVPYDGAGATGTVGQSSSAEVDRQNKITAGKPVTFAGTVGGPLSPSATWFAAAGTVVTSAPSTSLNWEIPLVMADGVVITAVESVTQRAVVGDSLTVSFWRVNRVTGAGTQIGSTQTNSTTGAFQTITQTGLSFTVDNTAYYYYASLGCTAAAAGACALNCVTLYYTSPDLTKSL